MQIIVFSIVVGVAFLAIVLVILIKIRKSAQKAIVYSIPGVAIPMCEYRCGALVSMYTYGSEFDDRSMSRLRKLRFLEELQLDYTDISDDGMILLKDLPRLKSLWLYSARIGDTGLTQLADLKNLQFMTLRLDTMSDEQLQNFNKLSRLKRFALEVDHINSAAVERLRAKLPNCEIELSIEKAVQRKSGTGTMTPENPTRRNNQ